MTATLLRTDAPPVRPLPRRRSSRLMLLAVVLAVVGALAGLYAYRSAVTSVGAVATTRAVPFGAVIGLADLREVRLPPDANLAVVSWSDVDRVVGSTAVTDLRAGQIVTPDSVGAPEGPTADEAVVGLSVQAGRVPSAGLAPRDQVLVITGTDGVTVRASILRAGEPDVSGRRALDVLVSRADAPTLALASVEDHVAVVLVGTR